MANNTEQFNRIRTVDNESGGSVYGKTFGGEVRIAFTRQGEFVHEVFSDGELAVDFPSVGLACLYDKDGFLYTVSIDVMDYFAGFTESEVNRLPQGGDQIRRVIKMLQDTHTTIAIEVNVLDGLVEIIRVDEAGQEITEIGSDQFNFYKGSDGTITIGGVDLAICMENDDDKFIIGMGEIGDAADEPGVVRLLLVNNKVEFRKAPSSPTPKDLQKLAGKILLN